MTAGVAGVIVGATAGGADIEAGVFRDLAATGRGRIALFAARLPGALAVLLPILLAAVALPALLSAVLSGGEPLTAAAVGDGALQVLASGALTAAISVGLAALFGARGMVMGVVLAVFLGIDPVLAQIEAIGDARHLIPQVAVAGLGGGDGDMPDRRRGRRDRARLGRGRALASGPGARGRRRSRVAPCAAAGPSSRWPPSWRPARRSRSTTRWRSSRCGRSS